VIGGNLRGLNLAGRRAAGDEKCAAKRAKPAQTQAKTTNSREEYFENLPKTGPNERFVTLWQHWDLK